MVSPRWLRQRAACHRPRPRPSGQADDNSKKRGALRLAARSARIRAATRGRMFRASATGTPKLVGMYARVGSSSPVQDPAEAEDDERAGGHGGAGPARGGLARVGEQLRAARALLDRPLTPYYLIAGITTLLLCLGLVMVLSTASIADLSVGESPYHDFKVQLAGILVGIPVMWVAAR